MVDVKKLAPTRFIKKISEHYSLKNPHTYWIDIISACNLKCVMCPQHEGLERPLKTMKIDTYENLIDQIYDHKPLIKLYLIGEPTLHKQLCEMIQYAHNRGCTTMIHTNATMLTRELASQIIDSKLDYISFSFDAATPEIYEKIRIGAKYENVLNNILGFLDVKLSKAGKTPHTILDIIKMKETESHLDNFVKFWDRPGVDEVHIQPYMTWVDEVEDRRSKAKNKLGFKPCDALFNTTAILSNGVVVPCCMDVEGKIPLGNIREQTLEEIWNGEAYNKIRLEHLEERVPSDSICYKCHEIQILTLEDKLKVSMAKASNIYEKKIAEIKQQLKTIEEKKRSKLSKASSM